MLGVGGGCARVPVSCPRPPPPVPASAAQVPARSRHPLGLRFPWPPRHRPPGRDPRGKDPPHPPAKSAPISAAPAVTPPAVTHPPPHPDTAEPPTGTGPQNVGVEVWGPPRPRVQQFPDGEEQVGTPAVQHPHQCSPVGSAGGASLIATPSPAGDAVLVGAQGLHSSGGAPLGTGLSPAQETEGTRGAEDGGCW